MDLQPGPSKEPGPSISPKRPKGHGKVSVATDTVDVTPPSPPARQSSSAARSLFGLFGGGGSRSRRPSVASTVNRPNVVGSIRAPSMVDSLYGGLESVIPAGQEHVGKFLSPQDAKSIASDVSAVVQCATKYRNSLNTMSKASADLGESLDRLSRARSIQRADSDRVSSDIQMAGGLQLLISNHANLLGSSIDDKFQQPILKQLTEYRSKIASRETELKLALRTRIQTLREAEAQSARESRKKHRNLLEYRTSLLDITSQIDDINRLKLEFLRDMQALASDLSEQIHLALASMVTAEIEIFESIAHKGWSGGGLEKLMSMCPDPFDGSLSVSQRQAASNGQISGEEKSLEQSSPPMFSVLPRSRSILPDTGGLANLTLTGSQDDDEMGRDGDDGDDDNDNVDTADDLDLKSIDEGQ